MCFAFFPFPFCPLSDARITHEKPLERTARALADVTTEVDWDDDPLMAAATATAGTRTVREPL
jgi:hypothetical protein